MTSLAWSSNVAEGDKFIEGRLTFNLTQLITTPSEQTCSSSVNTNLIFTIRPQFLEPVTCLKAFSGHDVLLTKSAVLSVK